jgi:deoxycytidylate deaminase
VAVTSVDGGNTIPPAMNAPAEQAPIQPLPAEAPELFIAMVAATGADDDEVFRHLESGLKRFGYECETVRLSAVLREFFPELPMAPIYEYIKEHQTAGNTLRAKLARADALALAAVAEVRAIREERTGLAGNEQRPLSRVAYLIRSLKTPEEVATLRDLYGDRFVLFSAYAARDSRVDHLARLIADSSKSRSDESQSRSKAERLVARDEAEESDQYGQNVRAAFPLADFFVDARSASALTSSIERCLDIFFGDPFRTPTRDEVAMFHAHAAALRSAELGRQVGAAIATSEGALIATGTNEVAKRGGGLYWEGDEHDDRDFRRGEDTNEVRRARLVEELLGRMNEEGWLKSEFETADATRFLTVFDDTRLANLIEFGRAVHAEMAALTDAAMRGVTVKASTLYTTTFPCHLCARHVVAAGVERLVYIHPYPKSLAAQLFEDSIAVDQAHPPAQVMRFEPFVGVAPQRFVDLFTAGRRKVGGQALEFVRLDATPKFTDRPFAHRAYLLREQIAAQEFEKGLTDAGLTPTPSDPPATVDKNTRSADIEKEKR